MDYQILDNVFYQDATRAQFSAGLLIAAIRRCIFQKRFAFDAIGSKMYNARMRMHFGSLCMYACVRVCID